MRDKKRAHNFKDITGQVFGKLTVIKYYQSKNNRALWICLCLCGKEIAVIGGDLRNGHTQSCGCLQIERTIRASIKHNLSHTRFATIWYLMRQRCYNKNATGYKYYGGRGISINLEWNTLDGFKEDMYESYLKHVEEFGEQNTTLDRIDTNKNYSPYNCKWATLREQARNKSTSSLSSNYDDHIYWHKKLHSMFKRGFNLQVIKYTIFERYIGMSTVEFRSYIESLLEPWMNWDNYGKNKGNWSIDHIIPCNRFDLSKEEDRLLCWNYKNLRPYDAVKNNKEHNRELVTI